MADENEDCRLSHTWRTVLKRYRVGEDVIKITRNERRYGDGAISRLAESLGMSECLVWECRRVANRFTEKAVLQFLRHELTWSHILILARPSIPVADLREILSRTIREKFSAEDLRLAIQKKYGRRGRGGRRRKKRPELDEGKK